DPTPSLGFRANFFHFKGCNEAGKSTTIKMIITLLASDGGSYLLNGKYDEAYIRDRIGVVFQENVCDAFLTVKENLMVCGMFYIKNKKLVLERYLELMEKLNLKEIENQRYKTLSGGQK